MAARTVIRLVRSDCDMERKVTAAMEFLASLTTINSVPGSSTSALGLLPVLRFLFDWTQTTLIRSAAAIHALPSGSHSRAPTEKNVRGGGLSEDLSKPLKDAESIRAAKRSKLVNGNKKERKGTAVEKTERTEEGEEGEMGENDGKREKRRKKKENRETKNEEEKQQGEKGEKGEDGKGNSVACLDVRYWRLLRHCLNAIQRIFNQPALLSPGLLQPFIAVLRAPFAENLSNKESKLRKEEELEALAEEMAYIFAVVLSNLQAQWGLEQWVGLCKESLQHLMLLLQPRQSMKGAASAVPAQEAMAAASGKHGKGSRQLLIFSIIQSFGRFIRTHPNPRKVFDAVVNRLLLPMVEARSALLKYSGYKTWDLPIVSSVEEVLERALFHEAHIGGYGFVCSVPLTVKVLPKKKGSRNEKGGEGGVSGRSYQVLLFENVEEAIKDGNAAVMQALPWLFEAFARRLAEHSMEAVVGANENELGEGGTTKKGAEGEEEGEGEGDGGNGKGKDGGRRTALFRFSAHFLRLCFSTEREKAVALAAVEGLLATARKVGAYAPIDDTPEGRHLAFLVQLGDALMEIGQELEKSERSGRASGEEDETELGKATIGSLSELLQLEHRAVESHFSALWPLLLTVCAKGCGKQGGDVWQKCVQLGCKLMDVYADLRQVERVLVALLEALRDCSKKMLECAAAASLSGSFPLQKAIADAVRTMPSGQVAPLLRQLAEILPTFSHFFSRVGEEMENDVSEGHSQERGKRKGGKTLQRRKWREEFEKLPLAISEILACVIKNVNVVAANAVQVGAAAREIAFTGAGPLLEPLVLKWSTEGAEEDEQRLERKQEKEDEDAGLRREFVASNVLPPWIAIFLVRPFFLAKALNRKSCTLMPPIAAEKALNGAKEVNFLSSAKVVKQVEESDAWHIICASSPFFGLTEKLARGSHVARGMSRIKSPVWRHLAALTALSSLQNLQVQMHATEFSVLRNEKKRKQKSLIEGTDEEDLEQTLLAGECSALTSLLFEEIHGLPMDENSCLEEPQWTGLMSDLTNESYILAHMRLLCDSLHVWTLHAPANDVQRFLSMLIEAAFFQRDKVVGRSSEESLLMEANEKESRKGGRDEVTIAMTAAALARETISNAELYEQQKVRKVWVAAWRERFGRALSAALGCTIPSSAVSDSVSALPELLSEAVAEGEWVKKGGQEMTKCLKDLVFEQDRPSYATELEKVKTTEDSKEEEKSDLGAVNVAAMAALVQLLQLITGLPDGFLEAKSEKLCLATIGKAERCLLASLLFAKKRASYKDLNGTPSDKNIAIQGSHLVHSLLEGLTASREALASLSVSAKWSPFADAKKKKGDEECTEFETKVSKSKWARKAVDLQWLLLSTETVATCVETILCPENMGTTAFFKEGGDEVSNRLLQRIVHATGQIVNGQCRFYVDSFNSDLCELDPPASNPILALLTLSKEKLRQALNSPELLSASLHCHASDRELLASETKVKRENVSRSSLVFVPRTVMLGARGSVSVRHQSNGQAEAMAVQTELQQSSSSRPPPPHVSLQPQLPAGNMYGAAAAAAVVSNLLSAILCHPHLSGVASADRKEPQNPRPHQFDRMLESVSEELPDLESMIGGALRVLLGGGPSSTFEASGGGEGEDKMGFWRNFNGLSGVEKVAIDALLQGGRHGGVSAGRRLLTALLTVNMASLARLRSLGWQFDTSLTAAEGGEGAKEKEGLALSKRFLPRLPDTLVVELNSLLERLLWLLRGSFPAAATNSLLGGDISFSEIANFLTGPLSFVEAIGFIGQRCEPILGLESHSMLVDCHLHLLAVLQSWNMGGAPSGRVAEEAIQSQEGRSAANSFGAAERRVTEVAAEQDLANLRTAVGSSLSAIVRGSSRPRLRMLLQRLETAMAEELQEAPENGESAMWASAAVEALEVVMESVAGSQALGLLATRCHIYTACLLQWLARAANRSSPMGAATVRPQTLPFASLEGALRVLTTIASRETIFPMTARHVALALDVPSTIMTLLLSQWAGKRGWVGGGGKLPGQLDAVTSIYVGCCRLLCALVRHRHREVRRCAALLGDSMRALLQVVGVVGEGDKCAVWLRRIYEEMAAQKASLSKYCVNTLSDYITAVAARARSHGGLSREVDSALRGGAYALMDASSLQDLQHLHASLGSEDLRRVLAELKRDYELYHKFTGKV